MMRYAIYSRRKDHNYGIFECVEDNLIEAFHALDYLKKKINRTGMRYDFYMIRIPNRIRIPPDLYESTLIKHNIDSIETAKQAPTFYKIPVKPID